MRWPLPEKRAFWTPESVRALEQRLAEGPALGAAGMGGQLGLVRPDEAQSFTLLPAGAVPTRETLQVRGLLRPSPQGTRIELVVEPGGEIYAGLLGGIVGGVACLVAGAALESAPTGLVALAGLALAGASAWRYDRERARAGRALTRLFPREDWR